ncbi:MAG: carboxypeptidase-like regulatory domain-containing protein [Bacteroidia bacterium]|nr:carboxypeptidase-like regulatory domain-containing protein [Bacteroidia bacterium]
MTNDASSIVDYKIQKTTKKVVKQIITGHVFDEKGLPAVGVTVTANEGADQTTTDDAGKFSIEINQGSTFLFEGSGYKGVSMNESHLISKLNRVILSPVGFATIEGEVELPYQTLNHYRTKRLIITEQLVQSP